MAELNIEADVENLKKVQEFVASIIDGYDCSLDVRTKLNIAVEELFVNIAHYAYPDAGGFATVRVKVKEKPLSVSIAFIDSGVPYNPLAKPDPDVTLPGRKRPVGGLGIYMVKRSMDAVSYQYKDGQNILTIQKKL